MGHEPSLNQLGTLYHKGGDDVFKIPEKEVSIDLEKARMVSVSYSLSFNKLFMCPLVLLQRRREGK